MQLSQVELLRTVEPVVVTSRTPRFEATATRSTNHKPIAFNKVKVDVKSIVIESIVTVGSVPNSLAVSNESRTWEQTVAGAREFLAVSRNLGDPSPSQQMVNSALDYLSRVDLLAPANVQCSLSDDGSIDIDVAWPDPRGGFRIAKINVDEVYSVVLVTKAGYVTAFESALLSNVFARVKAFAGGQL